MFPLIREGHKIAEAHSSFNSSFNSRSTDRPNHHVINKMSKLTKGVVRQLLLGESTVESPIVQILDFVEVRTRAGGQYRLNISDGIHSYPFVLLAESQTNMIKNGSVEEFSIVSLAKTTLNTFEKR